MRTVSVLILHARLLAIQFSPIFLQPTLTLASFGEDKRQPEIRLRSQAKKSSNREKATTNGGHDVKCFKTLLYKCNFFSKQGTILCTLLTHQSIPKKEIFS